MNTNDKKHFDRGYDDGYNDALKGRSNPVKCMTGNPYNDGYYTGYIAPKSQTEIRTSNYSNTYNNMVEMSLEVQKQRVLDLKSQLDLMIGRVEYMKEDLNGQLDRALENGLPVEIYQKYKVHYISSLYNGLDSICNRVQRDDMGYLNDVEVHLTEAINRK